MDRDCNRGWYLNQPIEAGSLLKTIVHVVMTKTYEVEDSDATKYVQQCVLTANEACGHKKWIKGEYHKDGALHVPIR